mgnify:FL=1
MNENPSFELGEKLGKITVAMRKYKEHFEWEMQNDNQFNYNNIINALHRVSLELNQKIALGNEPKGKQSKYPPLIAIIYLYPHQNGFLWEIHNEDFISYKDVIYFLHKIILDLHTDLVTGENDNNAVSDE